MKDSRYSDLAKLLTNYSVSLKRGERILIDAFDIPDEMVIELVRAAQAKGAYVYVHQYSARVQRELIKTQTKESFVFSREVGLKEMKGMQAYIALRGSHNIFEKSDIPTSQLNVAEKTLRPVMDWRVRKTKWCVLRWPTAAMAQQAGMSTEAFEDFYFRVCTLDYPRMLPGMKALKAVMDRTDKVRIEGQGTDLRFSIKGIGAITCGGTHNIPDGEVFSAPVRDSVEGTISFNAPTIYHGTSFDNVVLTFKKGKVVEAKASQYTDKLNKILNSDEGARYIGEFSLAFNPYILSPMRDILFDEKIAGSFHFTPGQAYDIADNGNRSQIHWDMVCIQRKDYGGGKIYFDNQLIREDGLFIPSALQKLNPDFLIGKSSKKR